MLGSILKGIGKGIGGVLGAALKAPKGRLVSPLVKGVASYAGYNYAADFVDEYSKGNFENQSTRTVAGIASFGLRFKGAHSLVMGGTRTLGTAGTALGNSMSASGNKWMKSIGGTVGNTAARLNPRGGIDNFLSALSPEKLLWGGTKLAAKGVGGLLNLPGNAAYGAGEYASLAARTFRAQSRAGGGMRGARAGWSTLGMGLSTLKHADAPLILGGLAVGGLSAFTNRYQPRDGNWKSGPSNWDESKFTTPLLSEHGQGAKGSVDPSNYPAGMSMGRGRSAVMSQSVMQGQEAVTEKMVKRRRV